MTERPLVEQIKSRALDFLLGIAEVVALSMLLSFEGSLSGFAAAIPPIWQVRVMIGLVAAIFLLIFLIQWHRPNWRFDEATGTWIDRKTNIRYCAACRANKALAPLRNESRGWRCMVCRAYFRDPARSPPEPSEPMDLGPQGWMR